MEKNLEEGQIVLCTVTKIMGTIVFVKVEEHNIEGTITFSEIAPGRIRNIREYAFPGKKIICKVLSIKPNIVELSLRRVKLKEKTEFSEAQRKEKSFTALLRTVVKEKAEKIIEKIKKEEKSLVEFLEKLKEDAKILEKYLEKDAEKIIKILQEKKTKETILKRKFSLSSKNPDGILIVKEIINNAIKEVQNIEISYIAAGKYLIKAKTKNPKQTDSQLDKVIENMGILAKKKACQFNTENKF